MTTKVPYHINEIDINKLCYVDVKSTSKKTIVYLKYNDNKTQNPNPNQNQNQKDYKDYKDYKNLAFQTPLLLSNNMIQCRKKTFELDVPLIGKKTDKVKKLINFLNLLDKKIIADAKKNNKWFEKFAHIKKTNGYQYQKIIRESTDNEIIRLKILKTDDFETILHINNNRASIEDINNNKDSWLKCILEIYAIWINEDGFGLYIRPIILSFKPCLKIAYNYKMMEDSDEIDDLEVDTVVNDNSIFIRSESEITSSVLELQSDIHSEETNSSDEIPKDGKLNSATSETE